MNNKNHSDNPRIIVASSDHPSDQEKTSVQLQNAQALMMEVQESIEDEAPTSIRPIAEPEGITRQFHSQIMPIVQNYFPQESSNYPQSKELNNHSVAPEQRVLISGLPPQPIFNPIPLPQNQRPVFSQPKVKFPADEDTAVNRRIPQIQISPQEKIALQKVFSKSYSGKAEIAIKGTLIGISAVILAVFLSLKLTQKNNSDSKNTNTVPNNLPSNSSLIAKSTATSVEPTPTQSTTSTPSAEVPEETNSAEIATSAAPSASIAQQPSSIPTYLKPSGLPTKLDPSDPYAETTSKPPIKPSTQKPTSTPGIIRDVPF